MSQDVEDKVVSVGGVKFKKPKVKEVNENGIRYKLLNIMVIHIMN